MTRECPTSAGRQQPDRRGARTGKPSGDDRSALVIEIADRLRRTRRERSVLRRARGERPTQLGEPSVRVPAATAARTTRSFASWARRGAARNTSS
jgi:hypothetical protein